MTPTGEPLLNPDYKHWKMIDQNLIAALFSTISISILPYVLNLDTTTAIWTTLLTHLQSTCRSRVIQLKNELHNLSLKNSSMTQYLMEVKSIVDRISAAGANLDAEDIILYILNGLPSTYQSFKTAIRTRAEPITLDALYSLLISEEVNLATEAAKELPTPQFALYSNSPRTPSTAYRGRGRSTYRGGRSTFNNNIARTYIQCQICNKPGHLASDCWHRTNLEISPPNKNNNRRALTARTAAPSTEWILDTGASSHLTTDLANIQQPEPYAGTIK